MLLPTHPLPVQTMTSTGKHVCFGCVHIRSYEVVLGDHPCCSTGCALSLGWEYQTLSPSPSLDDYEASRLGCRRSWRNLKTTWTERHDRFVIDQPPTRTPGERGSNRDSTTTTTNMSTITRTCSEEDFRHACRIQQRHRDRSIQRAEQHAFFQTVDDQDHDRIVS